MGESILVAERLSKRYGGVSAVRDVEMRVHRGEVIGLVGPNGAGKTTLLGMLLGVIRPTAGRIRLEAGLGRRGIAGFAETPGFMPAISVRRTIRAWARIQGASDSVLAAVAMTVGLEGIMRRRVGALSLGERQRLALAVTLLGDPDLLVLDEPGNGLDPSGRRELRRLLRARADAGKAVVISSHELTELEQVCTHLVLMNDGLAEWTGPRDQLAAEKPEFVIVSGDPSRFAAALSDMPAITVRVEADAVHVQGAIDGSAILRHLARRDLYPSELRRRTRTLSQAFFDLLGPGGDG